MSKLKVLIAEDSKTIQLSYQKRLSESQFEIRMVENGQDAIANYEEWHPDVVLLDFNMPIKNGYQVLQEIREEREDTKTTIIMVTTVSEKESIIACAKLGIQGYVVKPFKEKELSDKVLKCHEAHSQKAAR